MTEVKYDYIDTVEKLKGAKKEWYSEEILGVDLECENNLHHYGVFISLVQISSRKKNWIVDVLKIKDPKELVQMLHSNKIVKIFHDIDFDFRILYDQLKCTPKNFYDTLVASKFLGKTEFGLFSLLKDYFGIVKQQKYQMADWTKRPLSDDMISYAVNDTMHLIRLKNKLDSELKKEKMYEWMIEEMKALERMEHKLKKQKFFDLKGLMHLSDKERAILKRMYDFRDRLARKVNRPTHFIISTKRLFSLAKDNLNLKIIKDLKGVHPALRREYKKFYEAIQKGKKETVLMKNNKAKRLPPEGQFRYNILSDFRTQIGDKTGIDKHLLLSKEQMISAALGKADLRKWQLKVFEENDLPIKLDLM